MTRKAFLSFLFFSSSFFIGCGTLERDSDFQFSKKDQAKQTKLSEKKIWQNIKKDRKSSPSQKIKIIDDFISTYSNQQITLQAYLLKAQLLKKQKKDKEACQAYHNLIKSPFDYSGQWKVYRASAKCHFKYKKPELALKTLERFIRNPKESPAFKKQAARFQLDFSKKKKLLNWELIAFSHLHFLSVSEKEKQAWLEKGESLIQTLSPEQLTSFTNQSPRYGVFEGYLLYKTGQALFLQKDSSQAKNYFKKALSSSLSSNLKEEIKNTLTLIKKISQVNPYLIGVLVPLSGRRKALGEKVLRGLYMGLDMEKDSPWQMIVVDSKSHPDVVREQLDNLFYKHHVMALVGGLTSETAEVIAQKAELFATPAVVFSQKKGLSQNRPFIFQNAVTADQLLSPLIRATIQKLKIKETAILYPDDAYGKEYARLFSEIFEEEGGEIKGYEIYKVGEADFKKPIKSLIHLKVKDREEEFEKAKKEFLEKNPSLSGRSKKLTPENLLSPKVEFQAIFIPDSVSQVQRVKDHLKYFGLKNIYLLGTNIWNPEQISRQAKDFPIAFVNLPKKDQALVQKSDFYKNFVKSYAYVPGIFEQRAYNSALFLRQALEKRLRSRLSFQGALQKIKKFPGAYYPITVSEDQVFQYPLSLYKKGPDPASKLDSIPVK